MGERSPAEIDLRELYGSLLAEHGPQGWWWPAQTPFEMMAGAVLVQNTRWQNVEMSIARLRAQGLLHAEGLLTVPEEKLRELIRSSGFMRAKAAALLALARWAEERGAAVPRLSDGQLRAELLALRGIGPETADVIGLYAYARPAFVPDAYARRLLEAAGFAVPRGYEAARRALAPAVAAAGFGVEELTELHGLIVEEGKQRSRARVRTRAISAAPPCAGPIRPSPG
ncbi:endonuclease III domain-containing protein [Brevibacterium album]|uniref:endonuclease III domain-containing protein n=1 Tax=Brevibacterium album TaxID=417948 RepID=UPI0009FD726C|nr:hypothetical protein [Brevibacterium album]